MSRNPFDNAQNMGPTPITDKVRVDAIAEELVHKIEAGEIALVDCLTVMTAAVDLARHLRTAAPAVISDYEQGCSCIQCTLVRSIEKAGLLT